MARPSFKPTAAQRKKVAIAAGAGMLHEQMALALGISLPTFRKHFENELSVVAYQKRMEALVGIHAAAKRGSSSAAKAYLAVDPEFQVPRAEGAPAPTPGPTIAAPAPLAQPLGKKDQAKRDAVGAQAGTEWDTLLPNTGQPPIH